MWAHRKNNNVGAQENKLCGRAGKINYVGAQEHNNVWVKELVLYRMVIDKSYWQMVLANGFWQMDFGKWV